MNSYRKFDDEIKEMVIKSGNPDLFPELNIPRSTALYWIRSSKKRIRLKNLNLDDALKDKIEQLEAELQIEKAKVLFLKTFIKNLNGWREFLQNKKNKEVIVEQVLKFCSWIPKAQLCDLIGIKTNSFHRMKVEVKGCIRIGLKKCKILSANQLTFREQEKIYNLARDPRLSHMSIKGLQYYAFREGILACGYDSWRKYVKEFRGEIIKRRKVKKYNCGIRASRVNEIWHMDITEFKLKDGGKVYLQVIVDNFSRKVINWKLSQKKGQSLSVKTMLDTTKEIIPETLLIDGGGENTGNEIKKLFLGRGITALVAKKDVVFSNSMVESFFRILKQKFICKYRHYKLSRIYRIVERSVKYFNDTPLGIFHGANNEVYNGLSDFSDLREKLALGIGRSRAERPMINLSCASGNIVSFTI